MNLKPNEAAERLNVSVKTLQRWDRDGILVAQRTPTDRRYYTEEQVNQFCNKKNYKNRIVYVGEMLNRYKDELSKQDKYQLVYVYLTSFPNDDILTGQYYHNWGYLRNENDIQNIKEQAVVLKFGEEIWTIKHMSIKEFISFLEEDKRIQDDLDSKYPYLIIGGKYGYAW